MTMGTENAIGVRKLRLAGWHTSSFDCGLSNEGNLFSSLLSSALGVVESFARQLLSANSTRDGGRAYAVVARREVP